MTETDAFEVMVILKVASLRQISIVVDDVFIFENCKIHVNCSRQ